MKRKSFSEIKLHQLCSLIFMLMFVACSAQSPSAPTPTVAEIIPVTGNDTATALPGATSPGAQSTQATTAACTAPATLTPAVTEGPYFKVGSPERSSLLEGGITGTVLTLTGYVFTVDCKPVAHALLDFWQANSQGQYDNAGYTLRGHQYTDATGRYQLETVVPGLYPGRTEHIHVKVQAPNGPVLTTQLFFPNVSENSSDGIYNAALLINIQNSTSSKIEATYNFVVNGSQ